MNPARGGQGGQGNRRTTCYPHRQGCFRCGSTFHFIRDCRMPPRSGERRPFDGCHCCGDYGHWQRDCDLVKEMHAQGRDHRGVRKCRACQREGHWARQCSHVGSASAVSRLQETVSHGNVGAGAYAFGYQNAYDDLYQYRVHQNHRDEDSIHYKHQVQSQADTRVERVTHEKLGQRQDLGRESRMHVKDFVRGSMKQEQTPVIQHDKRIPTLVNHSSTLLPGYCNGPSLLQINANSVNMQRLSNGAMNPFPGVSWIPNPSMLGVNYNTSTYKNAMPNNGDHEQEAVTCENPVIQGEGDGEGRMDGRTKAQEFETDERVF